jgi:hypothetical protein
LTVFEKYEEIIPTVSDPDDPPVAPPGMDYQASYESIVFQT